MLEVVVAEKRQMEMGEVGRKRRDDLSVGVLVDVKIKMYLGMPTTLATEILW